MVKIIKIFLTVKMTFLDCKEIEFEKGKDYIITDKMDIYDIFKQKNQQIIILTLFKNKCSDLKTKFPQSKVIIGEEVVGDGDTADVIITTPLFFIKNLENYKLDTSFLILNEPHLIIDLNYAKTLKELRTKNNFTFIAISKDLKKYEYMIDPMLVSYNQTFYIECNPTEIFYFIFSVLKYNLFTGSVGILVENIFEKKRYEIFLKSLNKSKSCKVITKTEIEDICDAGVKNSNSYNNLLVLIDSIGINTIAFDRAVYLGKKEPNIANIKKSNFDFSKIEKYKYRIDDLLKAISPGVIKGKKEFNYARFVSLHI